MPTWGPLGRDVFDRTYSRRRPDGDRETWEQTTERVVDGNVALVGPEFIEPDEVEALKAHLSDFSLLPGGRHLWVSGVEGRQFLFNCHRAGWGNHLADHFCFTFNELMKGGGVGANYSTDYLHELPPVSGEVEFRASCLPDHPDLHEFAHRLGSPPSRGGAVFEVPDTREGWVGALEALLHLAEAGGGAFTVDVSNVRPRGSIIRGFGGTASGPGPLVEMLHGATQVINEVAARQDRHLTSLDAMALDHAVASCVVAGNVRRSARMSIKSWADEDILDFIRCKADPAEHWSTNISVEVDDDFFDALEANDPQACIVWEAVLDGMLSNGEPGFYNSSAASVGERGDVRSSNPCGEIALEDWEPCCLGHVNLAAYGTNYAGALEAVRLMARFLVRATFAPVEDPRQRAVLDRNRRIGVGLLGFQEWAAAHGTRYSEAHQDDLLTSALRAFRRTAQKEAADYAAELGIPAPIKTTTVAPTGSVSKLPGVSEGIHPIYARHFLRRVRFSADDPAVIHHRDQGRHVEPCRYTPNTEVVSYVCRDSIVDHYPEHLIEQVDEIDPADLLATQRWVQENYADNAVSFTMNVPAVMSAAGRQSFEQALRRTLPFLKGTTVFPDASRPQAPYERLGRNTFDLMEATATTEVSQALDECSAGACPVR